MFGRWPSCARIISTQGDEEIASCYRREWHVSVRASTCNRHSHHEELPKVILPWSLTREHDIKRSEAAMEVLYVWASRTHRANLSIFDMLPMWSSQSSCEHTQVYSQVPHMRWCPSSGGMPGIARGKIAGIQ